MSCLCGTPRGDSYDVSSWSLITLTYSLAWLLPLWTGTHPTRTPRWLIAAENSL